MVGLQREISVKWIYGGDLLFREEKITCMKINGENVSPQHLNYVIGSCRQVKAVETVGIESMRYGAVGVALYRFGE